MRTHACIASLILCGGCLWSQTATSALEAAPSARTANGESKSRGPAPRRADGKPDFSGIWIGGGPIADLADGLPRGQKIPLLPSAAKLMLHTVERYTRPEYGTLVDAITIDDPEAYAQPFTVTFSAHLFDGDMIEYICQENENSKRHLQGPAIPPTPELQPSSTLLPLSPRNTTNSPVK